MRPGSKRCTMAGFEQLTLEGGWYRGLCDALGQGSRAWEQVLCDLDRWDEFVNSRDLNPRARETARQVSTIVRQLRSCAEVALIGDRGTAESDDGVAQRLYELGEAVPFGGAAAWDAVLTLAAAAEAGGLEPRISSRRSVVATRRAHVPLMAGSGRGGRGLVGTLVLELVDQGSGRLFADPATMLVRRDFLQAATGACQQVWRSYGNSAHDLRWRLERPDGGPGWLGLEGSSAGGAFCLLAGNLLAGHLPDEVEEDLGAALCDLDLEGVAITVETDAEARFRPVGGAFEKLLAAVRDRTVGRIHTVVVAARQEGLGSGLVPEPENESFLRDPASPFLVLCAADAGDAALKLALHPSKTGSVCCDLGPRPDEFVGRAGLLEEVEGFFDSAESGYLVLVAGMGWGKTTLLRELVHRAIERGERPVYHCITNDVAASSEPATIARCLYRRLQRKHLVPEDESWLALPPAERLQRLLRRVSREELRPQGREVLYLDAADQVDSDRGGPLLPGVFPAELAPGVFCVITSRARLEWLRSSKSVRQWRLEERLGPAAARADAAELLELRGVPAGLGRAFIDEILARSPAPVFFTVDALLRKLESGTLSDRETDDLLSRADPWLREPEELLRGEAERVVRSAGALGVDEATVWQVLGLLAVARQPLSEADLQDLRLWHEQAPLVLRLAASFFEPRATLREPERPYRLDHPGYQREILRHVRAEQLHGTLARACERWKELSGGTRDYARRNRLPHLILAGEPVEAVGRLFQDQDWISELSERGELEEVLARSGPPETLSAEAGGAAVSELPEPNRRDPRAGGQQTSSRLRRAVVAAVAVAVAAALWPLVSELTRPEPVPPAPSAFGEKLWDLEWIAYEPTRYDPNEGTYPGEADMAEDLRTLQAFGFNGLITFRARGVLAEIPRLARGQGFLGVVMGLQEVGEPILDAAIGQADFVDAYCIGHNPYHLDRAELVAAMEKVRRETRRPVTTTFYRWHYDKELADTVEWIFPDVGVRWRLDSGETRAGSETAVEREYLGLREAVEWAADLSAETGKPALLKVVSFPSGGRDDFSEQTQDDFFRRMLTYYRSDARYPLKRVGLSSFLAYDPAWKAREDGDPAEAHTGLFHQDRTPKPAVCRFLEVPKGYRSVSTPSRFSPEARDACQRLRSGQ